MCIRDRSDRLQAAYGAGGGELASAKKRIDMLSEELKSSRSEVASLRHSERAAGAGSSGVTDNATTAELQAQLQSARRRVAELEQSASFSSTSNVENRDLHREIEARDRMIATLNTSLNQFGESGDTTSLMADVALRDRKIEELEALIATLKHS